MDMDSLVVTLPSQSGPQHALPVPPVPPNPEKDALLSALSSTLVAQTRRVVEQNNAAVAPLLAQQAALKNAYAQLQGELEQIEQLAQVLEKDEGILRDVSRYFFTFVFFPAFFLFFLNGLVKFFLFCMGIRRETKSTQSQSAPLTLPPTTNRPCTKPTP